MNWSVLKKMITNYQHLFKAFLSLVFLAALLHTLFAKKQYIEQIKWYLFIDYWFFLPLIIIMVAVNWSMEAKKWQLLTDNDSFKEALKVVLVGLLFKQFIPFAIGELSGRVLADNKTDKKEVTGAFMLVGFVQFSITVFFGCFGFFWLISETGYEVGNQFLVGLTISLFLIVVVFIARKKISNLYNKWFSKLKRVDRKTIIQLVFLSGGRYIVFFSQSLLIYYLFNNEIDILLLAAGISFVFLAKTLIPSMGFVGDLGIRGFSAILFFGFFDVEALPVVLASLSVWVINIFLPSFVALFLIRKLSFYSKV